jgi:hypothetical protein
VSPVIWLVLAYRLPAASVLKATIRRKLTGIGAIYPVNAVAVLPASPSAERALRRVRKTIAEAGGLAELLQAEVIEGASGLTAAFNSRGQEYEEIIAGCADFTARLEDMTASGAKDRRATGRWRDMNETCDRCGPAIGAAYRVDRVGELYLCGQCASRHWRALSAQGWTFWPLGVHALAPQASTGPGYGPAGEAVVPGRAARAGEGAGDRTIRRGGRPGR